MLCVFGRQLKLSRERAGMDRAGLGSLTGYSASTSASFEQAKRIHCRSSSTRRMKCCRLVGC